MTPQPLAGLRVVEFTHMVMGPTCGMVLADLGAEVIKVEPIDGDRTRHLLGAGAGFFPMFNRNKKSIAIDLQAGGRRGRAQLCGTADIVAENFKPGTAVWFRRRRAACDNRALNSVTHRVPASTTTGAGRGREMRGPAYMTGRPGDPLRAHDVNDIMGGYRHRRAPLAARHHRPGYCGSRCSRTTSFPWAAHAAARHDRQHPR